MENNYFIEPNLYTIDLKEYFNSLQKEADFPKKYMEELILINKLADDEKIITEINQLLNKHASKSILKAFNLKKKFPNRDKKNSVDTFFVLLSYAKKTPDLDIGKMYELLGFDELFFNSSFKDESLPEEIIRFNKVKKITILSENIKSIPPFIKELKNIEEIKIDNEYISDIPKELSELPFLKKLEINLYSFLSFPDSIFSFQHLESVRIYGRRLGNRYTTRVQIPIGLSQLSNLKDLSISFIDQKDLPEDLFKIQNLESLELAKFDLLLSLPSSIKYLKKLKSLKISSCANFENLPNELIELKELEVIALAFLPNLKEFSMDYFGLSKIKEIHFHNLGPFSIKKNTQKESKLKKININHPTIFEFVFTNTDIFKNLEEITITEKTTFTSLPATISNFSKLHTLNITCENSGLIEQIGKLPYSLRVLNISYNQGDLSNSMTQLHQLEKLTIKSKDTIHFSKIPSAKNNQVEIKATEIVFDIKDDLYIKHLIINGNVKNIENISYLKGIKTLEINSKELNNIPDELGNLSELKRLNLYGKFKSIPTTIGNLSSLEELSISTAYEIPVEKNGFNSIPPLSQLRSLKNLSLNNYEGSDYTFLDGLSSLETLELSHCHELVELPKAIKTLTKLSEIKIFMCDQFSKLNRQLENLSFLKKLYIYCDDLDADQFEEIAKLNQLEDLTIRVGWNKEPKILEIPPSITKLKKLKILELKLGNVKELPEFIDQLKNIEELYLNDFNSIKTLPASLIHLPKLKKLAIPTSIECLPNELRKLNLDTLILWTSKFAGSNVKQEVYSILVGPKTKFKRNRD